jgi:hypothetical protein
MADVDKAVKALKNAGFENAAVLYDGVSEAMLEGVFDADSLKTIAGIKLSTFATAANKEIIVSIMTLYAGLSLGEAKKLTNKMTELSVAIDSSDNSTAQQKEAYNADIKEVAFEKAKQEIIKSPNPGDASLDFMTGILSYCVRTSDNNISQTILSSDMFSRDSALVASLQKALSGKFDNATMRKAFVNDLANAIDAMGYDNFVSHKVLFRNVAAKISMDEVVAEVQKHLQQDTGALKTWATIRNMNGEALSSLETDQYKGEIDALISSDSASSQDKELLGEMKAAFQNSDSAIEAVETIANELATADIQSAEVKVLCSEITALNAGIKNDLRTLVSQMDIQLEGLETSLKNNGNSDLADKLQQARNDLKTNQNVVAAISTIEEVLAQNNQVSNNAATNASADATSAKISEVHNRLKAAANGFDKGQKIRDSFGAIGSSVDMLNELKANTKDQNLKDGLTQLIGLLVTSNVNVVAKMQAVNQKLDDIQSSISEAGAVEMGSSLQSLRSLTEGVLGKSINSKYVDMFSEDQNQTEEFLGTLSEENYDADKGKMVSADAVIVGGMFEAWW